MPTDSADSSGVVEAANAGDTAREKASEGHSIGRRATLKLLATAGVATALGAGVSGRVTAAIDSATDRGSRRKRLATAFRLRRDAAREQTMHHEFVEHPTNDDDRRYDEQFASYTKGLPHDDRGTVDCDAYDSLVAALESDGAYSDIPLGGERKLVTPQAAESFNTIGYDPHDVYIAPPPRFDSAEVAAEMVELYWQALLRDVPFSAYDDDHCLVRSAMEELSSLQEFQGPTADGTVTPQTLFRGNLEGALEGPYISQFFYKDIVRGNVRNDQQFSVASPDVDYLTEYDQWLAVQNGTTAFMPEEYIDGKRYIITGRDLATWVHRDPAPQAFINAALILLSEDVPLDPGNPYRDSSVQSTGIDFGRDDITSVVPAIAIEALHAAWYHKWQVHRRLRPEEYGGRVHNHLTGHETYPIHAQLLESTAIEQTKETFGSSLLPQAYPEGSPAHPSFPQRHATISAACITVLKAYFDGSATVPNPVRPTADGQELEPIDETVTVRGELHKLFANHSIGRDWAGIHYRTDGRNAQALGERLAIRWLEDRLSAMAGDGQFTLTTFDGEQITIEPSVSQH